MNRSCLSCHKEIKGESNYHPKCLEQLFGVSWIPKIPFLISDLPAKVRATIGKMSISGVQMKASIKLNKSSKEIEVAHEQGTHILKPEPNEYPEVPQNENVCMAMAQDLGMDVPPHGLFPMADGKLAYVVKRFDRLPDGSKIHKEDMAQLLSLPAGSKYEGSDEAIGKVIRHYAQNSYLDLLSFLERLVFNFIIGNGDMHLKNWSLLRQNKEARIAPCYDFVSTTLYIPDGEESALTINGKKHKLKGQDFLALAKTLKIESKAAENSIGQILSRESKMLEIVSSCQLSKERKQVLMETIQARCRQISS